MPNWRAIKRTDGRVRPGSGLVRVLVGASGGVEGGFESGEA